MKSQEDAIEELSAALRAAELLITYVRLADEPDPGAFLMRFGIHTERTSVPPRHDVSPLELAQKFRETYETKPVAILVPGREFDAAGTRHGRGGGWYDRFLAAVPRTWVRVGVLNEGQLSAGPLKRESWDEPMDWLLIHTAPDWKTLRILN